MAKKQTPATFEIKTNTLLKSFSQDELRSELELARKEYYLLTMKHSLGELKQPHLLTNIRRYIARLSTFLPTAL